MIIIFGCLLTTSDQKKKLEFNPEEKNILIKKRFKNKMIFLLYINILFIFLFLNSFVSQILIIIAN